MTDPPDSAELEIRLARSEERVRELEVAFRCAEVERDTLRSRVEKLAGIFEKVDEMPLSYPGNLASSVLHEKKNAEYIARLLRECLEGR